MALPDLLQGVAQKCISEAPPSTELNPNLTLRRHRVRLAGWQWGGGVGEERVDMKVVSVWAETLSVCFFVYILMMQVVWRCWEEL